MTAHAERACPSGLSVQVTAPRAGVEPFAGARGGSLRGARILGRCLRPGWPAWAMSGHPGAGSPGNCGPGSHGEPLGAHSVPRILEDLDNLCSGVPERFHAQVRLHHRGAQGCQRESSRREPSGLSNLPRQPAITTCAVSAKVVHHLLVPNQRLPVNLVKGGDSVWRLMRIHRNTCLRLHLDGDTPRSSDTSHGPALPTGRRGRQGGAVAAPSHERTCHLDVLAWEALLASAGVARNGYALDPGVVWLMRTGRWPPRGPPPTARTCVPRSRPMCWPPCCGWPRCPRPSHRWPPGRHRRQPRRRRRAGRG